MTDRFGILSCRIPPIAVALLLAANLVWIPQACCWWRDRSRRLERLRSALALRW